MCNEREKLIGYLYDECEASERAAVQAHVESCAECRGEIASLRSVREDLAAWEVPEHGSVWKPFVAAPASRWWRQVPQWAMAAAAGIILVSGAAGGIMAHALISDDAPATTQAPAGATPVSDPRELVALEKQIAMLRAELAMLHERVQKTSAPAVTPDIEAALHKTFDQQLSDLRAQNEQQLGVVQSLYSDFATYKKSITVRVSGVDQKIADLAAVVGARAGGQQ